MPPRSLWTTMSEHMDSRRAYSSHEVIILAGGMGRRLSTVLEGRPKPMLPILGKPLLEWMILRLRGEGFKGFILSVGYRREAVEGYFGSGDGWGVSVRYVREESPLGTGGALKMALREIRTADALVMNGDTFCMCDIGDFYRFHSLHRAAVSLCCVRVDDASRYGTVRLGPDSRVESFVEKGNAEGRGYINAGMYWMQRSFGEHIDDRVPLSLERDVFPSCAGGELRAYCTEADFIDVGTADSLARTPAFLARNEFPLLDPSRRRKKSGGPAPRDA